jgi:hypothetical protein
VWSCITSLNSRPAQPMLSTRRRLVFVECRAASSSRWCTTPAWRRTTPLDSVTRTRFAAVCLGWGLPVPRLSSSVAVLCCRCRTLSIQRQWRLCPAVPTTSWRPTSALLLVRHGGNVCGAAQRHPPLLYCLTPCLPILTPPPPLPFIGVLSLDDLSLLPTLNTPTVTHPLSRTHRLVSVAL